jgi:Asp-tRNA(Asn)/Glu-tRNA(Gln) amidotransferase A subunit family amidase
MLTAVEAAAAIERGSLSCEGLLRACLERVAQRGPIIHAWSAIDPERAIARARDLDRTPRLGPLHGLPVGAKDVIATTDFPTRYGSPIYAPGEAPAGLARRGIRRGAAPGRCSACLR